MGRRGGGVTPHGDGIQVTFYWRGKRWRPTLRIPPTPANLRYAERTLIEIKERIRNNAFRFADYFPDAKNAPPEGDKRPLTFGEYAKLWMRSRGDIEAAT